MAKWISGFGLALLIFVILLWNLPRFLLRNFNKKQQQAAEEVVQRFHEGYNAEKLEKVCEAVYGCSLSSPAKESWNSYVRKVREQAGTFRTVRSSNVQASIEPFGVRATYVSKFDKAECTEIFDLNDYNEHYKDGAASGGPLKIVNYRVLIDGRKIQ